MSDAIADIQETYARWRTVNQAWQGIHSAILARGRSVAAARLRREGKEVPRKNIPVEDADLEHFKSVFPDIVFAEAMLRKAQAPFEKRLEELAEHLPPYHWWTRNKGCAAKGLATIVAMTGDLSNYPNPAKLWRRCGLDVWLDGRANRRSSTDAVERAYSPYRRSAIWAITNSMLMAQARRGADDQPKADSQVGNVICYRDLYLQRRAHTAITHPDWTKGHSHLDAHRIVAKRLLRDLWVAWRAVKSEVEPIVEVPPANFIPSNGHEEMRL